MSILLSAGHNNDAPGACNGDVCEHEIALDWIRTIHYLLLPYVETDMIREGTLSEKVREINASTDVKIAIELHFNSMIPAKGSETLYYPGSTKGLELAGTIQKHFKNKNLFLPDRGCKEGWYQADKSKGALYFLRKTKCLSVIIEPQFISQLDDIMENKMYACSAISDALLEFYEKNFGPIYDHRVDARP